LSVFERETENQNGYLSIEVEENEVEGNVVNYDIDHSSEDG
jgi:hypothetical protein